MRKAALWATVVLTTLGGCESYGDLTSDAFDPGTASQSRFTLDAAECRADAEIPRSYDLHGIGGTHVERHEIYNRAFTQCMTAAGYTRRDWSPDIADPYKIDPTPF
jgi:hypothetical protein